MSSECVPDVSMSLSCTVFHKIKNCIQHERIIRYKIKQNGVTITLPGVKFNTTCGGWGGDKVT